MGRTLGVCCAETVSALSAGILKTATQDPAGTTLTCAFAPAVNAGLGPLADDDGQSSAVGRERSAETSLGAADKSVRATAPPPTSPSSAPYNTEMTRVAFVAFSALTLLAQDTHKDRAREARRQRPVVTPQFGYKEISRVDGGAPVVTAIASDGHRLARIGPNHGEIVDLDKETVTSIDYAKKQYSVTTFSELKKTDNGVPFKSDVTRTGKQKDISFFNVYEAIIKIQAGAQTLTADMWLTPGISGYDKIQAFQQLGLPPGQGPLLAELFKEVSKLDGIPMHQTISITGSGKPSEIVTELSAFSGAPIPPSKFAIPVGFKKAPPKRP